MWYCPRTSSHINRIGCLRDRDRDRDRETKIEPEIEKERERERRQRNTKHEHIEDKNNMHSHKSPITNRPFREKRWHYVSTRWLKPLGCRKNPGLILTWGPMLHVIPSLFQPRFLSLFNVLSINVKNKCHQIYIHRKTKSLHLAYI